MLPALRFSQSGASRMRLGGPLLSFNIHYANVSFPPTRIACVTDVSDDYTGKKCLACDSGLAVWPRMLVFCWDHAEKRAATYMAGPEVMRDIKAEFDKAGVKPQDIQSGLAPDVLLQRLGNGICVSLVLETAGTKGLDDGFLREIPKKEKFLEFLRKQSCWSKCRTREEAEKRFPRVRFNSQPDGEGVGFYRPPPSPRPVDRPAMIQSGFAIPYAPPRLRVPPENMTQSLPEAINPENVSGTLATSLRELAARRRIVYRPVQPLPESVLVGYHQPADEPDSGEPDLPKTPPPSPPVDPDEGVQMSQDPWDFI